MEQTSFFKSALKSLKSKNEYAGLAEDGIVAGDISGFIDSGSYIVNALLSAKFDGGYPMGKISAMAGSSGVGKTFFALTALKHFLEKHPDGTGFLYESESALSKDMLIKFGVDVSRVAIIPVETVQQFKHLAMDVLVNYEEAYPKGKDKPPILMILDSLGMLSTSKEMEDSSTGAETKDMTRAGLVRAAFRVLTLKLGKLGVTMLITNHTYTTMSLYSADEMAGGGGLKYAASTILFLSKKKEKDGTAVVGNVIHCKHHKGRLTRENEMVDTLIRYDSGLNRWYGMITFGLESGVLEKSGNRVKFPDNRMAFPKEIMKNPDIWFTEDVMTKIEEYAIKRFSYGTTSKEIIETEGETDNE